MDAVSVLIRLRAEVVRMAHEVEAVSDCIQGKGAPRARARAAALARRMRNAAMSSEAIAASSRNTPATPSERHRDSG